MSAAFDYLNIFNEYVELNVMKSIFIFMLFLPFFKIENCENCWNVKWEKYFYIYSIKKEIYHCVELIIALQWQNKIRSASPFDFAGALWRLLGAFTGHCDFKKRPQYFVSFWSHHAASGKALNIYLPFETFWSDHREEEKGDSLIDISSWAFQCIEVINFNSFEWISF